MRPAAGTTVVAFDVIPVAVAAAFQPDVAGAIVPAAASQPAASVAAALSRLDVVAAAGPVADAAIRPAAAPASGAAFRPGVAVVLTAFVAADLFPPAVAVLWPQGGPGVVPGATDDPAGDASDFPERPAGHAGGYGGEEEFVAAIGLPMVVARQCPLQRWRPEPKGRVACSPFPRFSDPGLARAETDVGLDFFRMKSYYYRAVRPSCLEPAGT